MFEGTKMHDTDEPTIRFDVQVELPAEYAQRYFDAMTGNDDDILLAAEKAMRERLGSIGSREVELSYGQFDTDLDMEREAHINRQRETVYGPVA